MHNHARDRAETPVQLALAEIWRAVLDVEHVGIHDDFLRIGGDSVLIMQAVARARRHGMRIEPRDFFRARTIAALEALVEVVPVPGRGPADGRRAGPPLVRAQRRLLAPSRRHPHHHNRSVLVAFPEAVDESVLASTLDTLVRRHDALRMRFVQNPSGRWIQESVDTPSVRLDVVEVAGLAPADETALRHRHAVIAQEGFRLDRPPLLRAVLFQRPAVRADLLIVAHRLVADPVSMRILLEDLHMVYAAERAGHPPVPDSTASFAQWAAAIAEDDDEDDAPDGTPPGPVGDPPPERARLTVEVDASRTGRIVTRSRATVPEVLLASLGHALDRVLGAAERIVEVELPRQHHVDDLDVSRTVGCGSRILQLRLTADTTGVAEGLRNVRQPFVARPALEFSYLGRLTPGLDARWQWRPRLGVDTSPWDQPPLSTVAYISRGRLTIELDHRTDVYQSATAQHVLDATVDAVTDDATGSVEGVPG